MLRTAKHKVCATTSISEKAERRLARLVLAAGEVGDGLVVEATLFALTRRVFSAQQHHNTRPHNPIFHHGITLLSLKFGSLTGFSKWSVMQNPKQDRVEKI